MSVSIHSIIKKAQSYLPSIDGGLLKNAYDFVKENRSDDSISVNSLVITDILADLQVDQQTLITSVLYQSYKCIPFPTSEVEKVFGAEIAKIYEGVVKLSKVQYKENMGDHEVEALQRMFFVLAQDIRVIVVKMAERLNSMRSIDTYDIDDQYVLAKETFEIYVPIADLLGVWKIKSQFEDLCFQKLFPEEYQTLNRQMDEHARLGQKYIEKIASKVEKTAQKEGVNIEIIGRKKHLYSIFQKMMKDRRSISELHDIYALRIITEDVASCYQLLGIIHGMYKPKPQRVKDYIANPKPNHYQSIHTTVVGEGDTVVEFQIRTQEMHREAEYGIASHFFYKMRKKGVTPWMKDILQLLKKYHDKKKIIQDFQSTTFKDRVMVFTDTGNIIDLPKGATVLDMAYHLGPQYGHCFLHAEVNGKKKGVTTVLNTGDTVKVIIDAYSHPLREWSNFVKTDIAKQHLHNFFRQETREKKMLLGRQVLASELKITGHKTEDLISRKEKIRVASALGYASFDELYIALGEGILRVERVIDELFPESQSFIKALWFRCARFVYGCIGKRVQVNYPISITLFAEDRFQLLLDISSVFVRMKINILSMNLKRMFLLNHYLRCSIRFAVKDEKELQKLMEQLQDVDNIKKVVRSSSIIKIVSAIAFLLFLAGATSYVLYFHYL